MDRYDLKFNGVLASSHGLIVLEPPPILRAKERIKDVTIPGRAGSLHVRQGSEVYENVLKTAVLYAPETADMLAVAAYLSGGGEVIFGSEETYAYDAWVTNQISFDRLWDTEKRQFNVVFDCQPFKRLAVPGTDAVITESMTAVNNTGTVFSAPVLTVEGTGDATIYVGSAYVMQMTGMVSGVKYRVDSDAGIVTDDTLAENLTEHHEGDFPLLAPGENFISWSGAVTKITVKPRCRYL